MTGLRNYSCLLLFALLASPGHTVHAISTNADQSVPAEFVDYVHYYAALQRTAIATLGPPLMWSDAEQLLRQQRRFARAMRESRPLARVGDVFTPAVARYFRTRIDAIVRETNIDVTTVFEPPDEDAIVVEVVPRVAEPVPWSAAPVMWPSMIAGLPELPPLLEYRLLGRHLIVMDVLAGLVVDVLYEALPDPEVSSS